MASVRHDLDSSIITASQLKLQVPKIRVGGDSAPASLQILAATVSRKGRRHLAPYSKARNLATPKKIHDNTTTTLRL